MINKIKCSLNSNFQKHKLYSKHHCPQIYKSLKLWFLFNLWKLMYTNIDVCFPQWTLLHTYSKAYTIDTSTIYSSYLISMDLVIRLTQRWFISSRRRCRACASLTPMVLVSLAPLLFNDSYVVLFVSTSAWRSYKQRQHIEIQLS